MKTEAAASAVSTNIKDLVKAVEEINAIVDIIEGIAGQTNLLSLNATIEAARAGVAGKGFAVVAAEVKELSTQTANATAEISKKIATVKAATSISVESINEIIDRFANVKQGIEVIAESMNSQSQATEEIARSASAANQQTSETSGAIVSVASIVQQSQSGAKSVKDSIQNLSKALSKLEARTEDFFKKIQ